MSKHFTRPGPDPCGARIAAEAAADRCRTCATRGAALCRAMAEAGPPGASLPTIRQFRKGQLIFDRDAPVGLGVIHRGYARRSTLRLDGKRILFGLAIPGDIVSGLTCRDEDCALEAATDVEVCLYDSGALQRAMRNSPRAASQLFRSMDDQHHRLLGALWHYGGLTSRERIIAFLVDATGFMPTERKPDGSLVVTMEIDRRDWADLTNTAVETISRTLRYLEEKRLVTALSPYRFRIRDLDRLALIAGIEPPDKERLARPAPARQPFAPSELQER